MTAVNAAIKTANAYDPAA